MLLGELSIDLKQVDLEQIARRVCKEVGFTSEDVGLDCNTCQVIINVQAQSSEIANAVHVGKEDLDMGAGDQGLMFGYATDEWDTKTLHPYSHVLAN